MSAQKSNEAPGSDHDNGSRVGRIQQAIVALQATCTHVWHDTLEMQRDIVNPRHGHYRQ
jgi:hypothetical protein